ncbi:PREDICTED: uncharacterized protein LOC104809216 isoform X2 [Tarenaya hassleriana]|uniref:uncharacterized protein LOC104809216 isoform X2 n=1 Tax=Tarenaya hassleriana TaxID=28532 RepID=UPI00053CA285|nr:PREDICTED: uncharacterized protein LOC104809216 isoform X2 [Tarenaya hassleriana]
MGGGDCRALPPDKDERLPGYASSASAVGVAAGNNARLSEAPVLLFVYFHKAFRAQLAELRRLAVDAAEKGTGGRDLAAELRGRFEFLKLVYKYHCAAEDEVVFLVLDIHVKNVVNNYSLEHAGIDDLFSSIFHWLDVLEEEREDIGSVLREVLLCIGTLQSSICQHMLKEERQVFPLLIEKFSFREQASLVWQFICSVPVMVLVDFLPWMMSFLTVEEKIEVKNCIKEVAPNEESLQQTLPSSGFFQRFWQWSKTSFFSSTTGHNPIHGLQLLCNAIKKDLINIREELCQIKIPSASLHLLVVRLNFLSDVLIFYSNALKKFFYPVLKEIGVDRPSSAKYIRTESCINNVQRLLYQNAENKMGTDSFLMKLREGLESLIMEISEQFTVQETEVFPIISKNCNQELQRRLLYASLHVLPLGLLKCVIIWFPAHLSDDESQSIIHCLSGEDFYPSESFARLLLQWFRIGYSGKISVENFWKELTKMFKMRCSVCMEHTGNASLSFSQQAEPQVFKLHFDPEKENKCLSHFLSIDPSAGIVCETPYSSGMNQIMLLSGKSRPLHRLPDFFGEQNMDDPFIIDLKPMDILFFFHKAMKKDLDYLVCGSARLVADCRFLGEFHQRFHLIKFLYQIHSDAEDEVAFPALEAKGQLKNISQSYSIDHELELEHFNKVSFILNEMSALNISVSTSNSSIPEDRQVMYEQLCLSLQDTCKSMHKVLFEHVEREETELWCLFRECFSIEEQEKIIARMLGRISGEILKDMVPWLMESLTPEEQHAMMCLWRQATRKTMFAQWLAEWYSGHGMQEETGEANNDPSGNSDPLEIVRKYLIEGAADEKRGSTCSDLVEFSKTDLMDTMNEPLGKDIVSDKVVFQNKEENHHRVPENKKIYKGGDKKRHKEQDDYNRQIGNPAQMFHLSQKSRQSGQPTQYEHLLTMTQEDLEAAIRRISRDSSLDPQKKSYIMQNLLMSRWIVTKRILNLEMSVYSNNGEAIPGQEPSYRDTLKLVFGCKHYKRNCKLLTPCCNQLFTCIRCHDEVADHSVDRKQISKMLCMKCLVIQPIGPNCSNPSCNYLSMGKYYCKICKLFDDEREIYHCPYCNLCRVGKGLGNDYFHCMKCNACMSLSLVDHVCREKCLEDNCPICHEYIFTSSSPVKALPCGHLMHSSCFQEYTCSHYTCPICSKSLGDMQVYFRMLDALLAEEKMPDEYINQTQVILCNDCERKGKASYHWLYHKCPYCRSYNTRLL